MNLNRFKQIRKPISVNEKKMLINNKLDIPIYLYIICLILLVILGGIFWAF